MNAALIKNVQSKLFALEAHIETSRTVALHAAELVGPDSDVLQALLQVLEERLHCLDTHPLQELDIAIHELSKAVPVEA